MKLRVKPGPPPGGGKTRPLTVAVVGNPNAGKTTVFNGLTGLSQRVGNYPGVTVEKKEGRCLIEGLEFRLIDLPGTYSLAAHSPDEMVAVDMLLGNQEGEPRPDLVLQIVDASNLERNLYLFTQVFETGVPVVIALNMMDVARSRGMRVDVGLLSERLGVPVVPVEGHRGIGLAELRGVLARVARRGPLAAGAKPAASRGSSLISGTSLGRQVEGLLCRFGSRFEEACGRALQAFEVARALIDAGGTSEKRLSSLLGPDFQRELQAARDAACTSMPFAALEAKTRYGWIRERLAGAVDRREAKSAKWTERIDAVLTHKVFGLAIFALLMLAVFQSIFAGARPIMGWMEGAFAGLRELAGAVLPEGALRSLVADGVLAGVGMVVMFLPQIIILFLFVGVLEDCGYMARAAFLMDKVMSKCGLSGKSFIPMLSGFACAVPGIMAARVIEDRRDRLATILVTPLMSCSARLPVYSILIGTFIPDSPILPGLIHLQALTLFGLYGLGITLAVVVALILRTTLLRGAKPPFILELPTYKWPSPRGVALRLADRGKAFLLKAGTTILAIAILVWALAYFPRDPELASKHHEAEVRIENEVSPGPGLDAALQALEDRQAGEVLRTSYLARMGKAVGPIFEPLGWDWRISMAVIASFPAREVVVSTLGTLFNLGREVDQESSALRESLRRAARPGGGALFTVPVAFSLLVFFALCCQCGATVVTIRRETESWAWAGFAFAYMTALAYLGAWVAYHAAGGAG